MASVKTLPPLWILRHGETEWNVEGRLQGHLDSPLTPLGLQQAWAQNRILTRVLPEEFDVVTSPSGRALTTAEIALNGFQVVPDIDPDLMEIQLGDWQGKTVDEIRPLTDVDLDHDPHLWKFTAPKGEDLDQMTARLRRVMGRIARPTVIVTHGLTSRLLRCLILGLEPERMSSLPGGQGNVHAIDAGQAEMLRDPKPFK